MATRSKAKRKTRPETGPTKPISFRLDKNLIAHIDGIAQRLGLNRNSIVGLVLKEYVVERGEGEILRLAQAQKDKEKQVDLFA